MLGVAVTAVRKPLLGMDSAGLGEAPGWVVASLG